MNTSYSAPCLVTEADVSTVVESNWFVTLVAAALGVAAVLVAYICTVCDAHSFQACYDAVVAWFNGGC